jgi:hypothetical protein
VHCFAALTEPVHVQDDRQVVELPVRGVLERFPDRSLRHLAVSHQHPDPVRTGIYGLRRQGNANTDGQAEAQRTGGDVDPWKRRAGVALEAAAKAAQRQELLVADRSGRGVERIEERRGVALGEDQVVVVGMVGLFEVVAEVLLSQHREQIRGGHRRGRMPRPADRGGPDRVDSELLGQLAPELSASKGWDVGFGCHAPMVARVCRPRKHRNGPRGHCGVQAPSGSPPFRTGRSTVA